MKKIIFCSLLSLIGFTGLNNTFIAEAKNKNKPPGLQKKPMQMPPGQYKKLNKNKNVYYTPRVYIDPNATIYTVPVVNFTRGTYYFATESPANITINTARAAGYNAVINLFNNRWIVHIW
jgi:hypothetical protein